MVTAVHVLCTSSGGARPRHVRIPCALSLCAHDVPCLYTRSARLRTPCCALGVPVCVCALCCWGQLARSARVCACPVWHLRSALVCWVLVLCVLVLHYPAMRARGVGIPVYRGDRPDGANASIARAQTARSWIDCLQTYTQSPSYRLLQGPEGPPSIAKAGACYLASPMLALRAPDMYVLAVHAFVFARLHFPCSRCVLLLCVPLLCGPCAVRLCGVCSCCACSCCACGVLGQCPSVASSCSFSQLYCDRSSSSPTSPCSSISVSIVLFSLIVVANIVSHVDTVDFACRHAVDCGHVP